jgi:hypothetical protein
MEGMKQTGVHCITTKLSVQLLYTNTNTLKKQCCSQTLDNSLELCVPQFFFIHKM